MQLALVTSRGSYSSPVTKQSISRYVESQLYLDRSALVLPVTFRKIIYKNKKIQTSNSRNFVLRKTLFIFSPKCIMQRVTHLFEKSLRIYKGRCRLQRQDNVGPIGTRHKLFIDNIECRYIPRIIKQTKRHPAHLSIANRAEGRIIESQLHYNVMINLNTTKQNHDFVAN